MISGAPKALDSLNSPSHFVIGLRSTKTYSDPANRIPWRHDRRMAVYRRENTSDNAGGSNSANDKLNNFLAAAASNPEILSLKDSATFLARQILIKLYSTLLRPVDDEDELDTSQSLTNSGLDSLIAIELRSWWKASFGFDISILEMLGFGSVDALGEHAAKGLAHKFGGSGDKAEKE